FLEPACFDTRWIHLHEQLVEDTSTSTHPHQSACHTHRAHLVAACSADGIDFIQEQDASPILAGESACLAVDVHHDQNTNPKEHTLEAGRTTIAKGDTRFSAHTLSQIAFSGARISCQQQATHRLTANSLELLNALNQLNNSPCSFQNL